MMRFRLKELMESPGAPTQAALARRIGVPRQQVNRLVKGEIERIDLKTLDRIYKALGCRSVDELIAFEPDEPSPATFRERFIGQLTTLTLSSVQGDSRAIYTDPAVRKAAEEFFDNHIAKDLRSDSLLASLHARLMQEMRDFVGKHGAKSEAEELHEQQTSEIERLVKEIPLTRHMTSD